MQLRKGQIIEIMIDALAFGGKGIGSFDGMRVFVDNCMPGDLVSASLRRIKKNYCEAQLVELLKPSEERIEQKCKFAEKCGGCQIQFMPYEKQLEVKKQHVIDCFERLGNIKNPPVRDVLASEEEFFYRNKMEFSFGYDADMNFTLGMHLPGRRYDILDIDECLLMSKKANLVVNTVRDFVKNELANGWVPYKYSCGEGFLRSLFMRESRYAGTFLVNLAIADNFPDNFDEKIEELGQKLKNVGVDSFMFTKVISKRGQKRQDILQPVYGEAKLCEELHIEDMKLSFDVLPDAFFQVNTYGAERLYKQVLDYALQEKSEKVLDLFCGTGTIGMFVSKHVGSVVGVELNSDAVKSARMNAEKNGISNIEFIEGDVAKVLEEQKLDADLVIVDPPRAGLTGKMAEYVLAFDCDKIVYVSCNPGTLARDCEFFLENGYKLKEVQPVDMFPHTFHIENVCLLEK